jgi:hypothetical protein
MFAHVVPALSLYVRTLRRAARAAGSPEALAQALGVSVHACERWLLGKSQPPLHIFLAAVDVIVTNEPDLKGAAAARPAVAVIPKTTR